MISVKGMHKVFERLDAGDAIMEAMFQGAVTIHDAQINYPTFSQINCSIHSQFILFK